MGWFYDSSDDRWRKLVWFTLVLSLLFVAFTIEEIREGAGPRELVTTILPGLVCLGAWRLCVWRRDR